MISYRKALNEVLSRACPLPHIRVTLGQSLGYVLARPVTARLDLPPFTQSAMDGYAVYARDTRRAAPEAPVSLRLGGTVYAGDRLHNKVKAGTAIKVMTGACIPRGADAVVKKEYCTELTDTVLVSRAVRVGENVRYQGAEFRKGMVLLEPGHRITPPVVGLLAACGYRSAIVHRKPKVALVVTGDELAVPGARLRRGQIYDANSYSLTAAVKELGITDCDTLQTSDQIKPLKKALTRVLRSSDAVIAVGGVSVGDRDLVKVTLEDLGVETIFWRVAIKPGKPNYFGIFRGMGVGRKKKSAARSAKLVFGLPGNPVSALVSFHQLVKPALLGMMGVREQHRVVFPAVLTKPLQKKDGRQEWVRGRLTSKNGLLAVEPTTGQESHMLGGLAQANCLVVFPGNETSLDKGEVVDVELLDWGR